MSGMSKEMQDKIYDEIVAEWTEKYGVENLDKVKLDTVRKALAYIPDADGLKCVSSVETGKTHLVPVKDIIMKGLKGDELETYPVED